MTVVQIRKVQMRSCITNKCSWVKIESSQSQEFDQYCSEFASAYFLFLL